MSANTDIAGEGKKGPYRFARVLALSNICCLSVNLMKNSVRVNTSASPNVLRYRRLCAKPIITLWGKSESDARSFPVVKFSDALLFVSCV